MKMKDGYNSGALCVWCYYLYCYYYYIITIAGGVILAADYSQLELRIIAHLSGDRKLIRVLNTRGADVFKTIASQWKNVDVEDVTAEQRAQAKQVRNVVRNCELTECVFLWLLQSKKLIPMIIR